MSLRDEIGFAPTEITTTLRIEGFVALAAAVTAFYLIGGNWWLFAALLLVPDLSMLGLFAGPKIGARFYNIVHTFTVPAFLGFVGWLAGASWLVPVAIIWIAHIGMDRAVGFGLKYPGNTHATHLGWVGKAQGGAKLAKAS